MNKRLINCIIITSAISGLMLTGTAQARMKCWTNNEGVRECGDRVPPEFAQQGHEEIGKGGLVREKTERAKTPEELAEEARLAKMEEEQLKAEEEKKLQDRILLETFSSEQDIERARDDRITALESTIKLTGARNQKIQVDLDKRISKAAADERAGKAPSDALLKDIDSLKRQIKNNNDFINDKRKEQEDIRQEFALDIERFRQLTQKQ